MVDSTEFDELLGGEAETPASFRFINSPIDVGTVFADTCMFATAIGTTVRLQFAEAIPGAADSADPGLKMKYVGNLVMPEIGFRAMVKYLNEIMPEQADAE